MDGLPDIDELVESSIRQWDVAGLALAVVKDDRVAVKGYGVREQEKPDLIDGDTIFAIASNTKAFTATALGLLVQEGKLRWDDRVVDYLPRFEMHDPYVTTDLRVLDLLCHRAGLGTWAGDLISMGSCYTRDEIIGRIKYIEPAYPFRAGYGYCNLLFAVAGEIIPAITEIEWDAFIRQRFFEPLGMTRSFTSTNDLARYENVAVPHVKTDQGIVTTTYRNRDGSAPAGAINSCVRDLAQWVRLQLGGGMHDGKQIVSTQIIEETRTSHTPIRILPAIRKLFPWRHFAAYGLGWGLADHYGRLMVSHTGSLDGMTSYTVLLPEEQLGIVILTNTIPHYAHLSVAFSIIDRVLGMPELDWNARYAELDRAEKHEARMKQQAMEAARAEGTSTSLPMDAFEGRYANQIYGEAVVEQKDGTLILRLGGHPDTVGVLGHWHYDTFKCRWSDPSFGVSMIPFFSDGQGSIDGFSVKIREDWIDPLEYRFTRIRD